MDFEITGVIESLVEFNIPKIKIKNNIHEAATADEVAVWGAVPQSEWLCAGHRQLD